MRTLSVALLLLLAGVLSVVSNVGLWVDRTVYDTDTFVATTDDVLDDEDVQEVLAERFSQELFVAADVDARLQSELPEGLKFLSLPLGTAAEDFLRNASLRLLERQPLEDTRNESLRRVHARLIATIEGDSGSVTAEGGALVIDLRPVLERVAEDVSGRDLPVAQAGGAERPEIPDDVLNRLPPDVRARLQVDDDDRLLSRLDIPEDAGRFVIEDSAVAWTYRIARYGNDAVYAVIGITVATYVLAIAVARDRRSALRNAGIVFAVAGIVSLAALLPIEYATREFAENDAAATSVVDIVTEGYKQQSLVMVGFGAIVAGVAVLFGNTQLAVALRSTGRRAPDAPSLGSVLKERVTALRIAGLVGGALVLMVWPDPTARTYLTTFALLGLYLLALFVLASDSGVAVRFRDSAGRLWERWTGPGASRPDGTPLGWIGSHAAALRIAGIVAAAGLLLFWPELTLRFAVMVVALGCLYLAAIDLAARPRAQ